MRPIRDIQAPLALPHFLPFLLRPRIVALGVGHCLVTAPWPIQKTTVYFKSAEVSEYVGWWPLA